MAARLSQALMRERRPRWASSHLGLPRYLIIDAVIVVVLALVIGSVLASLRTVRATPAGIQRAVDARPAGERAIAAAEQVLAAKPDDPSALANLASAYLLRVRETGDPSYYPKAETLLDRAQE